MMSLSEIKTMLSEHKIKLNEKFKVKEIGVFGSYIKGVENRGSDIDILIEFEKDSHISLIEFISLQNYLNDLLNVKVDLVEKKCLKKHIGERILQEVAYV